MANKARKTGSDAGADSLRPSDVKKRRRKPLSGVGRDPETGKNIPHERDEKVAKLVSEFVGNGADLNDIAHTLNLRPGVIKKHYAFELQTGVFRANMEVASAMKAMAQTDPVAGKFWLKARAGWKDGESAGQQTSPLQITIHT